jgi:hypothetical protein
LERLPLATVKRLQIMKIGPGQIKPISSAPVQAREQKAKSLEVTASRF